MSYQTGWTHITNRYYLCLLRINNAVIPPKITYFPTVISPGYCTEISPEIHVLMDSRIYP